MNEANQIRRDIETTQRRISTDVNALTEKVTPSRIVGRRIDRVRDAVGSAKDKVMGSPREHSPSVGDKIGSVASTAGDKVSSTASAAAEAISETPEALRRGTEGNPLAAGLIALGAGWLVASLLPASAAERRMAAQATDLAREHVQPVAQHAAEEIKDNLQEPAQEAVDSIKSEVAESASTVSDEARSATGDVADRAKESRNGNQ
ncbi:DUF3618 domain-containing protein [Amycolatopsis sp. NPDC059657]|uniref:DUF3618 domain-containing protein n=1 Tax=Amycolatopsis sp. NPDC059657 TaxID=3346899 RepID=UPI00367270CE